MALEIKQLEPTATVHVVTAEQRLWQTADKETLVPEGHEDAAFLYCVPGQQLSVDEATRYGLIKGTKKAAAKSETTPPNDEKTVDQMSGKELDELAAKLKVGDWKPKATVAAKKAALKPIVEAKNAETPEPEGLDDLSDEDLTAKATELEVEGLTDESSRDDVLAAVRVKLGETN